MQSIEKKKLRTAVNVTISFSSHHQPQPIESAYYKTMRLQEQHFFPLMKQS